MNRTADVTRNTNETKIRVAINLDGSGAGAVAAEHQQQAVERLEALRAKGAI